MSDSILLIGSNGMLARDVARVCVASGLPVAGKDIPEIDITDIGAIRYNINDMQPALVINCAAYTAVDRAESEPESAFAVNRDGPANIAEVCSDSNVPLIHISTDFVFSGEKEGSYTEEDTPAPAGVYGKSKYAGEQIIRENLKQHLIVRTAWLFGTGGGNFISTMLRLAREREEIKVVDDQHGCPTWTVHLAHALCEMSKKIIDTPEAASWGTYHFCGRGNTTWWRLASAAIEYAKRYETFGVRNILPISTDEYPTPAKRPKNSTLNTSKIERIYSIIPPEWEDGMRGMIDELYS